MERGKEIQYKLRLLDHTLFFPLKLQLIQNGNCLNGIANEWILIY